MASAKSRAARSKRTKDDLITEMEALEAKINNAEAVDPTTASLAKEQVAATRAAASTLSVDTIVADGAKFGLAVQRTVQNVTEQAAQKAQQLKTLQDAIAIETAELERLYELDVVSASIAALVADHEARRVALEQEIQETQKRWSEESQAHAKAVATRNAETETARRREEAEYTYRMNQERTKATDAIAYKLETEARVAKQERDAIEADIAARVAAVQAKEAELAAYKTRVDGIDAELKKAKDEGFAVGNNTGRKEVTTAFALERAELNSQLALANQRNASLEAASTKLGHEVVALHNQLAAAKEQVTNITIKALESASGQQALSNVKDLMKETPRNGAKS